MKRKLLLPLILLAAIVLSIPVFADMDIITMYVNRDSITVYEKKSKESDPVLYFSGGDSISIDLDNSTDKWAYVMLAGAYDHGWTPMKYLSYEYPTSYCNHNWSDWWVTQQATCTQWGAQMRQCSICGMSEGTDIPPTGHSWGNWTVVRQPTCTKEGEQVIQCRTCGAEERNVMPKVAHVFGSWSVIKQATCTAEGQMVHKCAVCGLEERATVDKLPHKFGQWVIQKEATCTEEGKQIHKCTVCGLEETSVIEKLPHDLEEKIIKETTDHSAGIRSHICKVCGYVADEESFDPEGTLRRGARGDEVKEVQQLLIDQEYLNEGGADGVFGGGTEQAVKDFQKDQKLEEDGVAWPQTIQKLQHDFGPWQVSEQLTRDEAGELVHKCKICGFEQKQTVEPTPILTRGDRGEAVRTAQSMLIDLDFDPGTADGAYGPKLDAAYDEFAKKNKIDFEGQKILPSQIDALARAWAAAVPAADWKGECEPDSPVIPILNYKPAEGSSEDNDIVTYSWSLVNFGEEDGTFCAILAAFGEDPDFTKDSFVLVLDHQELLAKSGNTLTGTCTVSKKLGKGDLKIKALVIDAKDKTVWLSR